MEEINELKNRIVFLETKYNELVEELVNKTCQCRKPMAMHFQMNEEQLREHFLNKIKE